MKSKFKTNNKTENILIRLTKEEKQLFVDFAKRNNTSVSKIIMVGTKELIKNS